ncbi:MAG: pyruvate formate lyase-activating protein [Clostridia bacterium]|nr:pyruvate formate lyase-activating protein [Clostridia bacterium]
MISVNSFQSMGAVDGPGVRFVVFLQGCNLRCKYCHNPETLDVKEENLYSAKDILSKVNRVKNYIFDKGGVTFSGGEPLLQAGKLIDVFRTLKDEGYHIALDTNGSILNDDVKTLMEYTDLVLLDMKMPTDKKYMEFTGSDINKPYDFFNYLVKINKDVWIRQVIIKGVNDNNENISFLKELKKNKNVKKIELLPFRKLCVSKYEQLKIPFLMKDFEETDNETIKKLYNQL